ncbi:hypothetical protein Tco_0840123 [Tanacetum coccineum]|uniref:Uncharacterized protein n=1 Tax=Tanacetum coccineum TaxID=301880 RepID=A0ABQ5ASM1_9ASTR
MKRVNTFVDYRTELVEKSSKKVETEFVEESSKKAEVEIAHESSSKRVGEELEQESIKKQKVDEDKETPELQSLIEIIPNEEEVAIDAYYFATKLHTIVELRDPNEERIATIKINKADGCSRDVLLLIFSQKAKRLNEVFGKAPPGDYDALMEKLDDFGDKYQV